MRIWFIVIIDGFELIIGSPFNKNKLTCEIYYKNEIVAEISQESDELIIEIYPSTTQPWLALPLKKFQQVLDQATSHLKGSANLY